MHVDLNNSRMKKLLTLFGSCGWREMEPDDMEALADRCNCTFQYGASKGVFLNAEWDFVVKIPYFGEDDEHDHCALEYEAYLDICKHYPLCIDLFAKIEFLGWYGEIPVYVQERIDESFNDFMYDHYEEARNQTYAELDRNEDFVNVCDKVRGSRLQSAFAYQILKTFGMAVLENLALWIVKTGQNDLHNSNVGFKGKNPCIFDFAGWLG